MHKTFFLKSLLFIIVFFISVPSLFAAENKRLRFAPLPMYKSEIVLKQYQGMLDYLAQKLDVDFEIVYHANYKELLEAIKNKEVDLAHLGPLPYAYLLSQYKQSIPLVQFLDAQGANSYTCSLVTRKENSFKWKKEQIKELALTQKLSTCGDLAMGILLQEHQLTLTDLHFHYSGTHSHVILDILLGDATIGGVRTSEFEAYQYLGLQEIARSRSFPGFILVGSQTLPKTLAHKIQKILTELQPFANSSHKELMREWGSNVKFGAIKADKTPYIELSKLPQVKAVMERP